MLFIRRKGSRENLRRETRDERQPKDKVPGCVRYSSSPWTEDKST